MTLQLRVCIDVDDLEKGIAFYRDALGLSSGRRRAQAAGATLEQGPQTKKWGRLAVLADPFGNGFCLLEFRGRGYDEMLDG